MFRTSKILDAEILTVSVMVLGDGGVRHDFVMRADGVLLKDMRPFRRVPYAWRYCCH